MHFPKISPRVAVSDDRQLPLHFCLVLCQFQLLFEQAVVPMYLFIQHLNFVNELSFSNNQFELLKSHGIIYLALRAMLLQFWPTLLTQCREKIKYT